MKWFGLTGGIGTGKSTVAGILQKSGVPVVDADVVSRQVTQVGAPGYQKVLSHFGNSILEANGEIDRRRLGQIVFQDKQKLLALESILHPLIQDQVRNERLKLVAHGEPFAIYDVPLLFEKNQQANFDGVIVVSSTEENQIRRVQQRNPRLSLSEIKDRINSQLPISEKTKKANFCLENDGSLEELELHTKELIEKLKSISK